MNDGELIIEGVDVLNGTPLLDIKPHVPEFDCYREEKSGGVRRLQKELSVCERTSDFASRGDTRHT